MFICTHSSQNKIWITKFGLTCSILFNNLKRNSASFITIDSLPFDQQSRLFTYNDYADLSFLFYLKKKNCLMGHNYRLNRSKWQRNFKTNTSFHCSTCRFYFRLKIESVFVCFSSLLSIYSSVLIPKFVSFTKSSAITWNVTSGRLTARQKWSPTSSPCTPSTTC